MTDPYERTPRGMMERILQRVSFLEQRSGTQPRRLQGIGSGSTFERDAYFGSPTTDAERAALANRKVLWYNTDAGWMESYYAPTGLAGLTAVGLLAGTAAGWYPVGRGPMWRAQPSAGFAAAAGSYVRGWDGVRSRGGEEWFTYNAATGGLQLHKAGVYRATWQTTIQTGSGAIEFYSRILNPAASAIVAERPGNTTALNASFFTQGFATIPEWPIVAENWLFLETHSWSANIHQAGNASQIRGNFSVEYIGPALIALT